MITAELRRLTATRMSIIALIALLLVPVLYGGLYLWANQDPYGRFERGPRRARERGYRRGGIR